MAAHSETFPWRSHAGNYKFFEGQLRRHDKVSKLTPKGGGLYELIRTRRDTLRVFICECYSFGIAEYLESVDTLGELDAVIINSSWCHYSYEAKRHCRKEQVGLFSIGEFMAALNSPQYWAYLTNEQKDYFQEHGWLE